MLKDKLPKRHRATILIGNIILLVISLGVMKALPANEIPFWLASLMVGFVGFAVFGASRALDAPTAANPCALLFD